MTLAAVSSFSVLVSERNSWQSPQVLQVCGEIFESLVQQQYRLCVDDDAQAGHRMTFSGRAT